MLQKTHALIVLALLFLLGLTVPLQAKEKEDDKMLREAHS